LPFAFQARFAGEYGQDTIRFKLDYLDANGNDVGVRYDSFAFKSYGGDLWRQVADERPVPKNAVAAKVTLIAKRNFGSYADVYVDDVYFGLK